ncbi:biliverdin-producing heme oxygenase [Pseudomonas saliphila]|uniref:biliverdin-producing heme oxygenase n=1 Tax=Pseudomonas saliphila TaxID=2586906 RepID=UPI00123B38E9|nr:biliverdin-producing heme oxygenase [Pseudomonas saliphila]
MGPTLLEHLRERTRPAHVALEAQPLLKRLLSSQLTESQYRELLQSMLAFYQALDAELVPATAALLSRFPDPDYRYLPRAPLLSSDCEALGCAMPPVPRPTVEPHLSGREGYLLGVLYVIEGSTQGGRFISRHLADTLDRDEHSGAGFFNLHRGNDSWAAFRRWLDKGLAFEHRNDIENIIEGADMTFSALRTHLDQWQLPTHGN